jgi:hypothetical protein
MSESNKTHVGTPLLPAACNQGRTRNPSFRGIFWPGSVFLRGALLRKEKMRVGSQEGGRAKSIRHDRASFPLDAFGSCSSSPLHPGSHGRMGDFPVDCLPEQATDGISNGHDDRPPSRKWPPRHDMGEDEMRGDWGCVPTRLGSWGRKPERRHSTLTRALSTPTLPACAPFGPRQAMLQFQQ